MPYSVRMVIGIPRSLVRWTGVVFSKVHYGALRKRAASSSMLKKQVGGLRGHDQQIKESTTDAIKT